MPESTPHICWIIAPISIKSVNLMIPWPITSFKIPAKVTRLYDYLKAPLIEQWWWWYCDDIVVCPTWHHILELQRTCKLTIRMLFHHIRSSEMVCLKRYMFFSQIYFCSLHWLWTSGSTHCTSCAIYKHLNSYVKMCARHWIYFYHMKQCTGHNNFKSICQVCARQGRCRLM